MKIFSLVLLTVLAFASSATADTDYKMFDGIIVNDLIVRNMIEGVFGYINIVGAMDSDSVQTNFVDTGSMYVSEEKGTEGFLIDTSDSTFTSDGSVGADSNYVFASTLTLPANAWIKYVRLEMKDDASGFDSVDVQLKYISMNDDSSYAYLNPVAIHTSSSNTIVGAYAKYVFEFSPAFQVPATGLYGLYVDPLVDTSSVSLHIEPDADYQDISDRVSITYYDGTLYPRNIRGSDYYARFWCPPHAAEFDGMLRADGIAYRMFSSIEIGFKFALLSIDYLYNCPILYHSTGTLMLGLSSGNNNGGIAFLDGTGDSLDTCRWVQFWTPASFKFYTGMTSTVIMQLDSTGTVDVPADFTAGTIEADNGVDEAAWIVAPGDTIQIVGGVIVHIAH